MNNRQYMMKMLLKSEEIMVDTSTLMDPGFESFVEACRDILLSQNRLIIIPEYVLGELTSHLTRDNCDKREKAIRALKIIENNNEIFDCILESTDTAWNTFADAEILSSLTLNRLHRSQLLITSDKNLSADAYNLNLLESCKGYPIKVCHVNRKGELHRCECVSRNYAFSEQMEDIPAVNSENPEDVKEFRIKEDPSENSNENDDISVSTILVGIGAFGAGVVLAKYWRPVVSTTITAIGELCA